MKFNTQTKILLVLAFVIASFIGFMVKLPSTFRHSDKELHSLFYFMAAAFLNILFSNKNILVHLLIFGILYLFGMSIEYAQEYSNKLMHTKIHGRYDPEDIKYNLRGLVAFSAVWVVYVGFSFVFKKATFKEVTDREQGL